MSAKTKANKEWWGDPRLGCSGREDSGWNRISNLTGLLPRYNLVSNGLNNMKKEEGRTDKMEFGRES